MAAENTYIYIFLFFAEAPAEFYLPSLSREAEREQRSLLGSLALPGGQLVLLLAGAGPGHGRQLVDGAHPIDGGVELLQLLADAVQLLGVWRQVAGVRLAGFATAFFT